MSQETNNVIKFTATETIGAAIGTAQDAHIGVVRGYQAARQPELVEAREVANQLRIKALTAKLMADLG